MALEPAYEAFAEGFEATPQWSDGAGHRGQITSRLASELRRPPIDVLGLRPETDVGPMINATQRERVETMVADARSKGVGIIISKNRYDGLHDDGACINAAIDEMHCAAGKACPVIEGLLLNM